MPGLFKCWVQNHLCEINAQRFICYMAWIKHNETNNYGHMHVDLLNYYHQLKICMQIYPPGEHLP